MQQRYADEIVLMAKKKKKTAGTYRQGNKEMREERTNNQQNKNIWSLERGIV